MEHLRALLQLHRPGVAVRAIEIQAGLSDNLIGYYFKPTSNVKRIPQVETLDRMAEALGCDQAEVFAAFAADLGYTEGSDGTED